MPDRSLMFVAAVAGHGGPVASLLDLLPAFSEHRTICVGPWSPNVRTNLEKLNVDAIYDIERARAQQFPAVVRRLRQLIKKERPSVIFANGLSEACLVGLALTACGAAGSTPVVVWIHNYQLPTVLEPVAGFIARKSFRWCAVSPLAANLVLDIGLASNVQIIPNPIAEGVIADEKHPDPEHVRVCFLGSERHYKGFDFMGPVFDATRHLEQISWRLQLPQREHPYWTLLEPHLADDSLDIRVLGREFPVRGAYANADIVFVPSRQESFCRVAAEAMANGIPVVASDLSPLRTLLGNDEAGFLVPTGDIGGYANAIERLVNDPDLRASMGEAGIRRVAKYDLATVHASWRAEVAAALA